MKNRAYADHAATTPLLLPALEAMLPLPKLGFALPFLARRGRAAPGGRLNHEERNAESSGSDSLESPKSHETINETINETIRLRPGISRADLIALVGRSRSTVARAVAELVEAGTIERRGSKKTGGYYPKN